MHIDSIGFDNILCNGCSPELLFFVFYEIYVGGIRKCLMKQKKSSKIWETDTVNVHYEYGWEITDED